jgi:hypothetical protein
MVAGISGASISFNSQNISTVVQKLQDLKATMSNAQLNTETDDAIQDVIDAAAAFAQNPSASSDGLTANLNGLISKIEEGESRGEFAPGFSQKLSGILNSSKTIDNASLAKNTQKIGRILANGIESLGELRSLMLLMDECGGSLDPALLNSIESAITDFVVDQAAMISDPEAFQNFFNNVQNILSEFGHDNWAQNLFHNDDVQEMVVRLYSDKVENASDVLTSTALTKASAIDADQTVSQQPAFLSPKTINNPNQVGDVDDAVASQVAVAAKSNQNQPNLSSTKADNSPRITEVRPVAADSKVLPIPKSINPDLLAARSPQMLAAESKTAAKEAQKGITAKFVPDTKTPITGFSGEKISDNLRKNQDVHTLYAASAAAATYKTRRELSLKDSDAASWQDLTKKPKLNKKDVEDSLKNNAFGFFESLYMVVLYVVQARLENAINEIDL